MVFLSISIIIALVVTIALPIVGGFWLKRKLNVPWRNMLYGVLAYFVVQALVTLLFNGMVALVQSGTFALSDPQFITFQVVLNVFIGALIGVMVRWAGMKYLTDDLDNLESAYGIGVGYGGAESIALTGISLVTTFITMLRNININPQTTTLDPEFVGAIQEAWQMSPLIPLAISAERISALIMHITVTILILQFFKRKKSIWLAAAVALELVMNGMNLNHWISIRLKKTCAAM